jgi:hypothetical protein
MRAVELHYQLWFGRTCDVTVYQYSASAVAAAPRPSRQKLVNLKPSETLLQKIARSSRHGTPTRSSTSHATNVSFSLSVSESVNLNVSGFYGCTSDYKYFHPRPCRECPRVEDSAFSDGCARKHASVHHLRAPAPADNRALLAATM